MNPTLQDDPRLSAWLMDEMTAGERAEFEQILESTTDGRAFADELRAVAEDVETALAAEPEFRLTEMQRERLFDPPARTETAPLPLEIVENQDAPENILPWKRLRYTGDVTEKIRMSDRMETRLKSANFPTYAISGIAALILGMLVIGSILFFGQKNEVLVKKEETPKNEELAISILNNNAGSGAGQPSRTVVGSTATGYAFRDPAKEEFRRSSFALKPGTASYQFLSNVIRDGFIPNPSVVQIEEMVNYFIYDYPEPKEEQSVSVSVESAPCPWEPGHQLVQIGLKGREAAEGEDAEKNVATDIDVQVEFDPSTVKEYRLIGYEQTQVADTGDVTEDANSDPSREFAAGDVTTALYEVIPHEEDPGLEMNDESLLTVHLNYNEPADVDDGRKARARVLASRLAFSEHKRWSDATSDFRFAASVAGFGMKLRDEEDSERLDFAALEKMAGNALAGKDKPRRKRFVELIEKMQVLKRR